MTTGPGFQAAVGRWLSERFEHLQRWLDPVPEPVLGRAVLAIAGVFVWATITDHRRDRRATPARSATESCHHHSPPQPTAVRPGGSEEASS